MITTILPTFRRPRLLARSLKSLQNQTFKNFKVLILDNASGDDTQQVFESSVGGDCRFKYICHQKNISATANFQYGLDQVDSPFFSFLSDDDVVLPTFFNDSLKLFSENPESMFSVLGTIYVRDDGQLIGMPVLRWQEGLYFPPDGLNSMLKWDHPAWTGILFRTKVRDQLPNLNHEIGIIDFDYELRAAALFPFVLSHIPGAILSVRSVKNQGRSNYPLEFYWPGWRKMVERIIELSNDNPARANEFKKKFDEIFKKKIWSTTIKHLIESNFEEVRRWTYVGKHEYKMFGWSIFIGFLLLCINNMRLYFLRFFLELIWKFSSIHLQRLSNRYPYHERLEKYVKYFEEL